MLKVYVAGRMSSPNCVEFLRNINKLQEWTAEVRDLGMAPFPVADDLADIMRTSLVTMEGIKQASLAWLRVADCLFLTPGWQRSPGSVAERDEALRCGIPVFEDVADLQAYAKGVRDGQAEAQA
jgi:hypothetical protein